MKSDHEFPADVELTIGIRIGDRTEKLNVKLSISDVHIDQGIAGDNIEAQLTSFARSAKRIVDGFLDLERNTISEGMIRKPLKNPLRQPVKTPITEKDLDEFIKASGFQAAERE